MADLIGFSAIGVLLIFTFSLSTKWPDISRIIFVALFVRIIVMLLGHYSISLPDSGRDAVGFEWGAWQMAKNGLLEVLFNNFPGINFRFHQWLIAIPYSIFGRSLLMMQTIGLFFGIGSVLLGWLLAKKLWDKSAANKVGWLISLYPSIVLYSVLPLREVYVTFFLLVAFYGVACWTENPRLKFILIASFGFIAGTFFHGAIILGFFIFLILVILKNLKQTLLSIFNFRIDPKKLLILSSLLIILVSYTLNKFNIPKLGKFDDLNFNRITYEMKNRLTGNASYPEWTIVEKPIDLITKFPARLVYFLFSPFPWDVKKLSHLIGVTDGLFIFFIFFIFLLNLREILRNPPARFILIILTCYLVAFAFGISNFGAGTRHRTKFIIELFILAAPLIPVFRNLIFLKRKNY